MPVSQNDFFKIADLRSVFLRFTIGVKPILLEKNTFTVMILIELCDLRKICYKIEEFYIKVSL